MSVKRLRPECLSCLAKKYLEKYPENAPEEKKLEFVRRSLRILACAPDSDAAPVVVNRINNIRREIFGISDDYADAKKYFNQVMMNREEEIRQKLNTADDPLLLGLQYAMVANYIDFGAMKQVDEAELTRLLESASETGLPPEEYDALKKDLERGHRLVYLTDNCGEIVMDKLLIEVIKKLYPHIQIIAVVKGGEVLNDATMEDAAQVGLTDLITVIHNGNNIAGTWLDAVPLQTQKLICSADVILSKGQANYETLRFTEKNIYYLFLCKCEMFAREFGVAKFTGMLLNELRRP